ncbi:ankyrin repeat-containing domain protein [Mycena olivaceomarginata]|nr:ankyrin repeat-containing domain protein [Mycena olivaceomarginata]
MVKSYRLSKHIKSCPGLRGEIEKTIIERCDGMFLLAKLNIDSLVPKHTVKAVRDALKNIPADLDGTYDDVMERINRQCEEDRNLARRTLTWISNAETVLHISQLTEALAIEPGTIDLDPDNLLDMDIILSVCAGLVVISGEDHLVRLIHYTAQDYLDRIQDREFPHAHSDIAAACITYLSFPKFGQVDEDPDLETLLEENPLLEYALLFGLIHARGLPERRIRDDITGFLTHLSVDYEYTWQSMYRLHASLPRTRLGIAAYFGMPEVVKYLVEEDGFEITALRGATINGHIDIVRLLMKSRGYREHVELRKASQATSCLSLETTGNGSNQSTQCVPPLQAASLEGDEETVHILLEIGVDVNTEAQPYGTALHAASVGGHYPVVCILLAYGASVNSQSGMYGTPLRAASLAGHTDIVLLLLDNGAEIDMQAGKHGSALAAALSCGREEVALLLIEHGANANDPGARGWTALGLAAGNGYHEIVHLLLQKGVNVNASSGENKTALQAAECGGHSEITSLLINAGAEVKTGC